MLPFLSMRLSLQRYVASAALVALLWVPAYGALAEEISKPVVGELTADPAVKTGRLPSGMRYLIMKNATPVGQAVLRLRIGAGSLQESDAQQGLAHFLEHMAFKGSTHVPEGEMIKILERKGLAFGADTNAETDYTETVYKLDLPEADDDTLDTGLMLMRETASELTLSPKAFDSERGVILSEERVRDTPDARATNSLIDLLIDGQRATKRRPIGKVDVISNAPVGLVADYYRSQYRPDNATLIVVGDVDPAAIEAKIKARFADWTRTDAPPPAPDLGTVRPRGLTSTAVEVPGAATKIQIGFVQPFDATPDGFAKRRRDLLKGLGLAVLNTRLTHLAKAPNPPFMSASSGYQNLVRSATLTLLSAESTEAGWQGALGSIVAEQRRLVEFGVTQAELDREIADYRASMESGAAGAGTRQSVSLATSLVNAVDDGTVFTTPADDLALYSRLTKDLKAEEVNAALRVAFAGAGPLVQLTLPKLPEGIQASLRSQLEAAEAAPVSAPAQEAKIVWPYTAFGTPGSVVERQEVADLGFVTARFANNVRLIVKQTKFSADQVLVNVQFGNGRLALPLDKPSASWASWGFEAGGLKAISQEDMGKALTGVIASINFDIDDRAFKLSGTTRPVDLLSQLQVLAAYASDPGFRPEAFPQTKAAFLAYLPQLDGTAANVLSRDMSAITHSRDPRWGTPSRELIEATGPEDLKKLLLPAFAAGPLDVTIVGNIAPDEAIALVAKTFGALPKRDLTPPAAASLAVHFPDAPAEPIVLTHKGRADQAIAMAAWKTTDFFTDMSKSRALILANTILQTRLLEQIRIAEGATYSPSGSVEQSMVFPGYGYAYAYVETPPAKIDSVFANMVRITRDMADKGVSADELVRAKAPTLEGMKQDFESNTYWLNVLSGAQAEPRQLAMVRTRRGDYEKLTTSDIQAAVKTILAGQAPLRVVVRAESLPKS